MSGRTRLLGVDYGSVRIGLAISDPDRRIASPLAQRTRSGAESDAGYFRRLIQAEDVGGIVLGLPLHLAGHEGAKAAEVRNFSRWLTSVTGMTPILFDERFSTVEAEYLLADAGLTKKRRKARRDQLAAQIFLQAYLDAGCPPEQQHVALDS